jgi:hypothetical protein
VVATLFAWLVLNQLHRDDVIWQGRPVGLVTVADANAYLAAQEEAAAVEAMGLGESDEDTDDTDAPVGGARKAAVRTEAATIASPYGERIEPATLPHKKTSANTRPENTVVVIGAGVSGLSAMEALLAKDPTLNVIVLEARTRAGGRILTEYLPPLKKGGKPVPCNIGANFVHGCDVSVRFFFSTEIHA